LPSTTNPQLPTTKRICSKSYFRAAALIGGERTDGAKARENGGNQILWGMISTSAKSEYE